jgi:hypothetical protein
VTAGRPSVEGPLRAGLVINPHAWSNRRRPAQRRELGAAFAPLGEVVETGDAAQLPALLGRWSAEGVRLVAVSGGDGTVHAVINTLLAVWAGPLPRLLLLHGGTMGVAAHAVCTGAPIRQVTAVQRACARGDPLPVRPVETLRVGGQVAFNFGLGLFAALPAELERSGVRGPAAIRGLGAGVLASTLVGGSLATRALRGWHGNVRRDGETLGKGHLAGLYATTLDGAALLHLRGFEASARPAGHLRVLFVDATRQELVRSFVPFALGWPGGVTPGVRVAPVRVLELEPYEAARYALDGELHTWEGPLTIEAGPVLEVVVV